MNTIVLTGGGTAGHIIPNLALVPELKKHFDKIAYIGGNGMEKKLVEAAGIPFFSVDTVKFDRAKILSNLKIPFLLSKGISQAKKILTDLQPSVVFSKGGFVALPACYGAKKLNIPLVVHESDFSVGLANKLSARFAKTLITSFDETEKGIFIGNPVRNEILAGNLSAAKELYKVDESKRTILIFGGSLGATAINEIVYKALPQLLTRYNIIHISGKKGNFNIKYSNYFQLEYTHKIADIFALADLIVCRAGANTLYEVAACGKRCITIPLPKGASRGDQEDNAKSFEKSGFVSVLPQSELFVESLIDRIDNIWKTVPKSLDVAEINKKIVAEILKARDK